MASVAQAPRIAADTVTFDSLANADVFQYTTDTYTEQGYSFAATLQTGGDSLYSWGAASGLDADPTGATLSQVGCTGFGLGLGFGFGSGFGLGFGPGSGVGPPGVGPPGVGPRPGDRRRRRAPGGLQRLPGPDQQAAGPLTAPARHAGSAF